MRRTDKSASRGRGDAGAGVIARGAHARRADAPTGGVSGADKSGAGSNEDDRVATVHCIGRHDDAKTVDD